MSNFFTPTMASFCIALMLTIGIFAQCAAFSADRQTAPGRRRSHHGFRSEGRFTDPKRRQIGTTSRCLYKLYICRIVA